MLRLKSSTDPAWVERALAHIDEILVDHATCEKKAASMALTLLFRYPDRADLLRPLSALAREEMEHFELVIDHIEARGGRFHRLAPGDYGSRLMQIVDKREPARLLDTLLCCAVIEARSCERMMLLADALADPEPALAALYRGLLASEARHHALYVDLADRLFDRATVRARLDAITAHEAEVLREIPPLARMHT
ncbi:MAG: tRNA-(ms[2]io[6]A)-hydroxylase [bacterium]